MMILAATPVNLGTCDRASLASYPPRSSLTQEFGEPFTSSANKLNPSKRTELAERPGCLLVTMVVLFTPGKLSSMPRLALALAIDSEHPSSIRRKPDRSVKSPLVFGMLSVRHVGCAECRRRFACSSLTRTLRSQTSWDHVGLDSVVDDIRWTILFTRARVSSHSGVLRKLLCSSALCLGLLEV